MKFSQFLFEAEYSKSTNNQADIIFQQILDNLDHGHITIGNSRATFNIGHIIKKSELSDLQVVIRKMGESRVRLAINRENQPTLVVDISDDVPERTQIDALLREPKMTEAFLTALKRYLTAYHPFAKEKDAPNNSYEGKKAVQAEFEEHYDALIKKADEMFKSYRAMIHSLHRQSAATGSQAEKQMIEQAKNQLKEKHIGKSFNAFKSLLLKIPAAAFVEHLDAKQKATVMSRLESYYEHQPETE
jgi:hypothetical protein